MGWLPLRALPGSEKLDRFRPQSPLRKIRMLRLEVFELGLRVQKAQQVDELVRSARQARPVD